VVLDCGFVVCLQNLLESQFDDNPKLKEKLTEIDVTSLRSGPTGRDKDGNTYWFFMVKTFTCRYGVCVCELNHEHYYIFKDKEYTVRLFNEKPGDTDASSWIVVAK
jgi:hypothetical protein